MRSDVVALMREAKGSIPAASYRVFRNLNSSRAARLVGELKSSRSGEFKFKKTHKPIPPIGLETKSESELNEGCICGT